MFMYVQNQIKEIKRTCLTISLFEHSHTHTVRLIHVQSNIKEIRKNKKHFKRRLKGGMWLYPESTFTLKSQTGRFHVNFLLGSFTWTDAKFSHISLRVHLSFRKWKKIIISIIQNLNIFTSQKHSKKLTFSVKTFLFPVWDSSCWVQNTTLASGHQKLQKDFFSSIMETRKTTASQQGHTRSHPFNFLWTNFLCNNIFTFMLLLLK